MWATVWTVVWEAVGSGGKRANSGSVVGSNEDGGLDLVGALEWYEVNVLDILGKTFYETRKMCECSGC